MWLGFCGGSGLRPRSRSDFLAKLRRGRGPGRGCLKRDSLLFFLRGAVAQNANKGVSVSQTHNIRPVDTVFLKKPVFGILTKDPGGVGNRFSVNSSSGYRIGPFEIESVIMELPYVLECGVSAAPDEVRGQVVKASIVLVKGTEPTEELKKEIQNYVKEHTAPYKYPRIVVFKDELPKTVSGKIQRNLL